MSTHPTCGKGNWMERCCSKQSRTAASLWTHGVEWISCFSGQGHQRFIWWQRNVTESSAFPDQLYPRVSGQHLSSRLLRPEAAETEPPDQLQFPKGQEERPVDGRTDGRNPWTWMTLIHWNVLAKQTTWRMNSSWSRSGFSSTEEKNSWATTNILFFSIIKEYNVEQISPLIYYSSSHKLASCVWSFVVFFFFSLWKTISLMNLRKWTASHFFVHQRNQG